MGGKPKHKYLRTHLTALLLVLLLLLALPLCKFSFQALVLLLEFSVDDQKLLVFTPLLFKDVQIPDRYFNRKDIVKIIFLFLKKSATADLCLGLCLLSISSILRLKTVNSTA